MPESVRASISKYGFAFLPSYHVQSGVGEVALSLGDPIARSDGGISENLIPRAFASPNTYSGIYGLAEFPFHTDLAHWLQPPRFILLRCSKGYQSVFTLLHDGAAIADAVTRDLMMRALFKPRRPQRGASFLLRLCERFENADRFRWDQVFLRPACKLGQVAHHEVGAYLRRENPTKLSLIAAGDTLLIDNWRMLHARSLVPRGCEDRRIERVYLRGLH